MEADSAAHRDVCALGLCLSALPDSKKCLYCVNSLNKVTLSVTLSNLLDYDFGTTDAQLRNSTDAH